MVIIITDYWGRLRYRESENALNTAW